jgi:hypothetical protein
MSLASLASYRQSYAHFFLTFIRAMWRALIAFCLSILSQALWARICAHMHPLDYHAAPLILEAYFSLRVFLYASSMALLNSFTSLSRYSWAMTPQQIADGLTGTMLQEGTYSGYRGNDIINASIHKTRFSGLALYPFGASAGMSAMLLEG